MNPDEQEALSRKYSNDVVIILPLKSTRWAIFDSARTLCEIVDAGEVQRAVMAVAAQKLKAVPMPGTKEWYGRDAYNVEGVVTGRLPPIDLEELEL